MIARTYDLHHALHDVQRGEICFYPGLSGGHPAGFGWTGGGELPATEQLALATVTVVHLVTSIPACVCGEIGCTVVLTAEGKRVLSEWDRLEGNHV